MTRRLMFAALLGVFFSGNARYLCAQESNSFVETFRQGTVNMSRETLTIVNSIHSVEDVDRAEPKLAAVMNDFVVMINGLSEYLEQGFEGTMENLNGLQNDPELQEWNEKVNGAIEKLQQEHPDAAARLTEIGALHSQKLMQAMTDLMQKLMAREMPAVDTLEEPHSSKE